MPRSVALIAAALCLPALGCGGATQAEVDAGFSKLEREMRGLRDAYESQSRRLQAVQDRLEFVEDQLEARALHGPPVPQRLPVVRLTPDRAPMPAARTAPPPDAMGAMSDDVDGVMPEPAAELASGSITQADMDALDGGAPPPRRRSRRRVAVEPPANAAQAGNIGVTRLAPQPDFDGPRPPTPPVGAIDDPLVAFKAAESRYRSGDLPAAIRDFDAFVGRWPTHGYADNALYLSGRCRYARAEYAEALAIFRRVLATYPTGNQVPDALLMIGLTQDKLGRVAEGRETLARLRAIYPDTAAAREAQARLDRTPGRM